MLLTPIFSITQDSNTVFVRIRIPFIRISSAELIADGKDFHFHCKPYLLHLTFPYEFVTDEDCHAVYNPDVENGIIDVSLHKLVPGQDFPNLDLISTLLRRNKSKDVINSRNKPKIEVLNSQELHRDVAETGEEEDLVDHHLLQDMNHMNISASYPYGFLQKYTNVLRNISDDMLDSTEIFNPDEVSFDLRRNQRVSRENALFDAGRYIADFLCGEEDPLFIRFMEYHAFWIRQWDAYKDIEKNNRQNMTGSEEGIVKIRTQKECKVKSFEVVGGFSTEEETVMSSLKRQEILLPSDSKDKRCLLLVLCDILYAYCYDMRFTEGDLGNVESAHNIARLSAAFSWMDAYGTFNENTESIIKYSLRRSLIYPYLRHWKLSRKVLTDVTKVLFLGKRTVLKCLLAIKHIFDHTTTHYLLSKIYLDDYCQWIQLISDEELQVFAEEYNRLKMTLEKDGKSSLGFYLPELEEWARKHEDDDEDPQDMPIPDTYRDYTEVYLKSEFAYLRPIELCYDVSHNGISSNVNELFVLPINEAISGSNTNGRRIEVIGQSHSQRLEGGNELDNSKNDNSV